jgi:putative nucleotidyltransferase with HDIG domain
MANSTALERNSAKAASEAGVVARGWWNPRDVLRRAFFAVEILTALALFAVSVPDVQGSPFVLGLLLALTAMAALYHIEMYGNSAISVTLVPVMAAIVLFGETGAVLAGPIQAASTAISRRHFDFRSAHNSAMLVIVYWSAATTYDALATVHPEGFTFAALIAVIAATAVIFMMTAGLMSIVFKLVANQPFTATWEKHSWLAPHFIALGFIGFGLALAYVGLGAFGIVVFMTPAAVLRLAMKQYVDKTTDHVNQLEERNTELASANVEIGKMRDELRDSYDGTLEALVNALDARDQETKGHSLRVSRYMMDIARELGVVEDSREWVDMQRGSLLHDVGKIGVSDNILLKPGKLTNEEWKLMRLHPEIGYNMLHQVKFLEGPAEIILAHHERWDGQGYPRGLHEDEIPLGARIFPVVDTFDAMTSDRPYRRALSTQQALNEILKYSGSQFDPRVVEAFLDTYSSWVKRWAELHEEEESMVWLPRAA